jgi:hypothetical protein
MSDYTRSQVGRAAAILTTGEVAGTALDLSVTKDHAVTVTVDFTIGSLTNVVLRFYASMDNSTYDLIYIGGVATTNTLTATDTVTVVMPSLAGYKFFRASAQGTGTVTSSSATITYRYDRIGSR